MHKAVLKEKEERRLLRGHLWAYRNEFEVLPAAGDGEVVEVVSKRGRSVGRGYYQASGGIAVRLLAKDDEDVDEKFLSRRVDTAVSHRDRLFTDSSVYRWVYGDSDRLPGLIADRYGALVVAHAASPFYTDRAAALAAAFLKHDDIDGVLLAFGKEIREFGNVTKPVSCQIHGLTFSVDPVAGQKTGLFLDQRENWTLLKRYAKGARVLDGHCYTGAWALHAAKYGATTVLGVDTSKPAIETARTNAEQNAFADLCTFEAADLRSVLSRDDTWNVVMLDPPAFAKSRGHLKKALGLYQALNRDAMKKLKPGGILITSSCSQPLDQTGFIEMLKRAANSAQRSVQLLEVRRAAPDHPALLAMPETDYLKCAVLRVF